MITHINLPAGASVIYHRYGYYPVHQQARIEAVWKACDTNTHTVVSVVRYGKRMKNCTKSKVKRHTCEQQCNGTPSNMS